MEIFRFFRDKRKYRGNFRDNQKWQKKRSILNITEMMKTFHRWSVNLSVKIKSGQTKTMNFVRKMHSFLFQYCLSPCFVWNMRETLCGTIVIILSDIRCQLEKKGICYTGLTLIDKKLQYFKASSRIKTVERSRSPRVSPSLSYHFLNVYYIVNKNKCPPEATTFWVICKPCITIGDDMLKFQS